MGIESIDEALCTGCGICVENCMMDVFRMDKKRKKAVITYPEDCAVCFICEQDCPEHAVTVTPEAVEDMVFIKTPL